MGKKSKKDSDNGRILRIAPNAGRSKGSKGKEKPEADEPSVRRGKKARREKTSIPTYEIVEGWSIPCHT